MIWGTPISWKHPYISQSSRIWLQKFTKQCPNLNLWGNHLRNSKSFSAWKIIIFHALGILAHRTWEWFHGTWIPCVSFRWCTTPLNLIIWRSPFGEPIGSFVRMENSTTQKTDSKGQIWSWFSQGNSAKLWLCTNEFTNCIRSDVWLPLLGFRPGSGYVRKHDEKLRWYIGRFHI